MGGATPANAVRGRERWTIALPLTLTILLPAVLAQESGGEDDAGRQQVLLQSKMKLLERSVRDSPAASRIEASGPQTNALLEEARAQLERAGELLRRGELDAAGRSLDTGLRIFGHAARLVADPERELDRERDRYLALRERGAQFLEAFARAVAEKGVDVADLLDRERYDERLRHAATHAQAGRFAEANGHLAPAVADLERALAQARHRETLVRSLSFESAEEAYDYELERNRSHRALIALMLIERPPPQSGRTMIDRLMERNEAALAKAAALDAGGDVVAATTLLEQGTEELVRALHLLGLVF